MMRKERPLGRIEQGVFDSLRHMPERTDREMIAFAYDCSLEALTPAKLRIGASAIGALYRRGMIEFCDSRSAQGERLWRANSNILQRTPGVPRSQTLHRLKPVR